MADTEKAVIDAARNLAKDIGDGMAFIDSLERLNEALATHDAEEAQLRMVAAHWAGMFQAENTTTPG